MSSFLERRINRRSFLIAAASVALGLSGCGRSEEKTTPIDKESPNRQSPQKPEGQSGQTTQEKIQKALTIELETLDGEKTRLASFKGKPMILAFWIPQGLKGIPYVEGVYFMEELTPQLANSNVQIVAIATSPASSREKVNKYIDQLRGGVPFPFPVLIDTPEADLAKSFFVQTFPSFIIIDQEGQTFQRIDSQSEQAEIPQLLQQLTAGK